MVRSCSTWKNPVNPSCRSSVNWGQLGLCQVPTKPWLINQAVGRRKSLNSSEFCQVCTQLGEEAALPVGLSQPICATCFTSVGYPMSISCSFTTAIMVFTGEGWMERYREKEVCNWTMIFRIKTKRISRTEDLRDDPEALEDPFHLVSHG
jgi:hypothetical protein